MKKTLKTIIGVLTLTALASAASAQVAGENPSNGKTAPFEAKTDNAGEQNRKSAAIRSESGTSQPESGTNALVGAVKSEVLIGMGVVNHQGEKLGSVEEIAVDVESGRIVQVILSTGGFLGVGTTATAVPPGALVSDTEGRQLKLDAGKQHLLGTPPFDTSKWSEAFTREQLTASYKHFGVESSLDFLDKAEQPAKPFVISESRLGHVQRASEVVGTQVTNLQNEDVGEVEEILLDLSAGRILALVVTSGEYLGIEGELSAIPSSAFRFSTDREVLQIDTNKADLGAAPHFNAKQWPDFTQADTAGAIFTAHSVKPHFRSGSAADRRIVAGESARTNEATTGAASADMATTTAIKSEIRALENVSLNARNVRVVTENGHTTLSGSVDTAEEKELIGEIADRNNKNDEVENLLVVKIATTESE